MTPRQIKLLHAIIDEFTDSASAVGSVNLVDKHKLGVSPATIRNEMSDLVEQGYLAKPHSSSGRIPTNLAYRYFIDEILNDLEEVETQMTANLYEELFQLRFEFDTLLYQALERLSSESRNASFALLDNRIYYSGLSFIPTKPEFDDPKKVKNILNFLEDRDLLKEILSKARSQRPVKILFGDDANIDGLENSALVFSEIKMHGGETGYISVFGPNRMNYPHVIPIVNFFSDSLNRVVSGW